MKDLAEQLATTYRRKMLHATEVQHNARVKDQWRAEWQDTEAVYRDVWAAVAVEAVAMVAPVAELVGEPEPVGEPESLGVMDFEPQPAGHGGATLDQSEEPY